MKVTCVAKITNETSFQVEDRGRTVLIQFTDPEFANLMNAANIEEMTTMPGENRMGLLDPAVAFAIYALVMLKPGNQCLPGTFIELGKQA